MEVIYFIISIIEIILTIYFAFVIFKADKSIISVKTALENTVDKYISQYKKFAIILSSFNKILKLYLIYLDELKKYKKIYKAIKNFQNAVFLLTVILGIKNHKKLNFKKLIKFI